MNTSTLKEEIHLLVDEISDDEVLKAVQTLLKPYSHEHEIPEEHWLKIEKDDVDYNNGIGKNYTWNEVEELLSRQKK